MALHKGVETQIPELADSVTKSATDTATRRYREQKFQAVYGLYKELSPIVEEIEEQEFKE